jgi:hypothetical protein
MSITYSVCLSVRVCVCVCVRACVCVCGLRAGARVFDLSNPAYKAYSPNCLSAVVCLAVRDYAKLYQQR